jgi:dTDP-4-dehydrorhamnose reductase
MTGPSASPFAGPHAILVVGRNGQLGRELMTALAPLGPLTAWGRKETAPGALEKGLDRLTPAVIVNAAAWTRVDAAEAEPEEARLANASLPAALAAWAERRGALLVHYSTDYVFDGAKRSPYLETDPANPLNAYGRTKLEGDSAVLERAPGSVIFRTSWVYSNQGRNFPETILAMARTEPELEIDDRQVGAPTPAWLLAQSTCLAVRQRLQGSVSPAGLYNLAAAGETTWLGFARRLLERARDMGLPLRPNRPHLATPGPGVEPRRARRPLNSRLDTSKIRRDLGIVCPDWRWCLDRFLETVIARHRG